jgi:hypothetical protein
MLHQLLQCLLRQKRLSMNVQQIKHQMLADKVIHMAQVDTHIN